MTPHNEAEKGDYASLVLMPGDPLRARLLAHELFTDLVCVNTIRNCLGYTGKYFGSRVSIQASGMGQPSLAIYATELFKFYSVDTIIRVGTCGALLENLDPGSVVVGTQGINDYLQAVPAQLSINNLLIPLVTHKGAILATDIYYQEDFEYYRKFIELGTLAADMETYALYSIANQYNKQSLTVDLVSNNIVTDEALDKKARDISLLEMTEAILKTYL